MVVDLICYNLRMKKSIIIFAIIIIVTSIAWYMWTGREGVRTYYQGYVQIEPIATEVLIERLEQNGCTENGTSCHYVFDKENSTLSVNLYKKGLKPFGPGGGFRISENKLYAGFDIEGRRDYKKFENAVREQIQKVGGVIVPLEGTWTIIKTSDTTNVVY